MTVNDVLRQIDVNVHCDSCGDFTVGADVVAESQHLLAAGCPGSTHECPPQLLASLLDPSAVESLLQASSEPEVAARVPIQQSSTSKAVRVVVRPNDKLDAQAIPRWEADGGAVPRTQQGSPC